jgi:hypothetical protein
MHAAARLQWIASIVLTVLGVALMFLAVAMKWVPDFSLVIIGAFALATLGLLGSEFARCLGYIQEKPQTAFKIDLQYTLLAALLLLSLIAFQQYRVAAVLAGVGLIGLLLSVKEIAMLMRTQLVIRIGLKSVFQKFWECARWALPSVVMTWCYGNAYIYVVNFLRGAEDTAEMAAGRLLLMPMGMAVIAGSNFLRPKFSRYVGQNQTRQLNRIVVIASAAIIAGGTVIALALHLLLKMGGAQMLGSYAKSMNFIIPWAVYFSVNGVRTVGMNLLLVASHGYGLMFRYGAAAFVIAMPLLWFVTEAAGGIGAVWALVVVEIFLCLIIWLHGWPHVRRKMCPSS